MLCSGHSTAGRADRCTILVPDGRGGSRYSGRGRWRLRLISERCRLASRRRRFDPRVGRVGRRTTSGITASRNRAAMRCLAALRF